MLQLSKMHLLKLFNGSANVQLMKVSQGNSKFDIISWSSLLNNVEYDLWIHENRISVLYAYLNNILGRRNTRAAIHHILHAFHHTFHKWKISNVNITCFIFNIHFQLSPHTCRRGMFSVWKNPSETSAICNIS